MLFCFFGEGEKSTKRFSIQENITWKSDHVVIVMDIFKIQTVNVAQSAEALGSSKRKQNKIRIF
jgi:hypothetical protein